MKSLKFGYFQTLSALCHTLIPFTIFLNIKAGSTRSRCFAVETFIFFSVISSNLYKTQKMVLKLQTR